MEFNAPCLMGCEALAADELKFNGFQNVRAENGRVLFDGDVLDGVRANMLLRCAERVLLVLARFRAESFTELFDGVYAVEWQDLIPRDGAFPVTGYSVSSALFSVPDCQRIIKKAVAKKLGESYGLERMPETGSQYKIRFSLLKDRAEIMLDMSGEPLHKRGYRPEHTEASMKETLAASVVKTARWKGREPLWDPMCGAGTLVIEAVQSALKIAPGLNRRFDFENWGLVSEKQIETVREQLRSMREERPIEAVTAMDIDPNAVRTARENARRAGVEKYITFKTGDAITAEYPSCGTIMTDPPYGVRLMDAERASELVRGLGRALKGNPMKKYILSADEHFEDHFGIKSDKRRKLYNGMIKCYLYMYFR